MHKRVPFGAMSLLMLLIGCGGSGGGASDAGTAPAPPSDSPVVGSARFTVNALTKEVSIEPLTEGRAAYNGNAVSFSSSVLLSEGSPERRVLRVAARNNMSEAIGDDGRFRLVFGGFQNQNIPTTGLMGRVKTTTYFGNGVDSSSGGPLRSATVSSPKDLAYDEASGSLYVQDGAGTILVERQGTVSILSTSSGYGPVAVGPGFLFISSQFQIHKMGLNGVSSPIIGGDVYGTADGDFATARFTQISDICVVKAASASDWEILVADGGSIRRAVLNASHPGGLVTTENTFASNINSLAEHDGVVYATMTGRILAVSGANVGTIGSTTTGFQDGAGTAARFWSPQGIAWMDGCLYVADQNNNRVRQLALRPGGVPTSPASWWVATVSGTGAPGADEGIGSMTHNGPMGLVRGRGQSVFVADKWGCRVRIIVPVNGRFESGLGNGAPPVTELPTLINATGYTTSVPAQDPYIQEAGTIPAGGTASLKDWQFTLPEGLNAFSFIVTIEAEMSVPGVLPAGNGQPTRSIVIRGFAGSAGAGYADGSVQQAAFNSPNDIAVARDGTLFISDYGNCAIRRIDRNGQVTTIAGGSVPAGNVDGDYGTAKLSQVNGLDCSPEGDAVFFVQVNHVLRAALYSPSSGLDKGNPRAWRVVTLAGADGTSGIVDGAGSNARFSSPQDVLWASPTTLYVADYANNKIRQVNLVGPTWTAGAVNVASAAGDLYGQPGAVDGGGTTARFNGPARLALSPKGAILISDTVNNRIRSMTSSGVVSTLAGSTAGYVDGASGTARFNAPIGLAVEPSGYVYVGDSGGHVVRRISPSGAVATVIGGVNSGDHDYGYTELFQNLPGLAVSPGGDVYVAGANRIRLIQRIVSQ